MTQTYSTPLAGRGVLRIAGADREAFLQALVTQDVAGLVPGRPRYGLLLTPQGRFLYDFFLYAVPEGDALLLETEAAWLPDLAKRLAMYKLRSQVTLTDCSADFSVYALWREDRKEIESNDLPSFLAPDPRLTDLGWRGLVPQGRAVSILAFEAADPARYHDWRLSWGVPDGGCDLVPERSLPAEFNLDGLNAISFTKGCYVGQEMTARLRYRALLKRRAFAVAGGALPASGASITLADDRAIGEMVARRAALGLALLALDTVAALTFTYADGTRVGSASATLTTASGVMSIAIPNWQRSLLPETILGKI